MKRSWIAYQDGNVLESGTFECMDNSYTDERIYGIIDDCLKEWGFDVESTTVVLMN